MLKINERILKNFLDSFLSKKRFIALCFFVVLCCLFFGGPAIGADLSLNKEQILNALEQKYAGKEFETDFTQVSRLAALDISEKASGKAFFSHPGKMLWEYMEPEQHKIITNGQLIWIFRPQENQVMQGDASRFFNSGSGGAFLSDISLVRKNFDIRIKAATQDYIEIEMAPKKQSPDIVLITVNISRVTHEIVKVVTYNSHNDTTVFEFSNIQFKKMDPIIFDFKAPEGISIINMD